MGGKNDKKTFWFTFGLLLLFWMLISWRLHWQHLLVGVLASWGITRINQNLLLLPAERPLLIRATAGKWVIYFYLLVVAIFKANWDVAKIVLKPKLEISPSFIIYRTMLKKPLNQLILGNSITLTPGTLTVETIGNVYVVHALTRAAAEDCSEWEMMHRLTEIEEVEQRA
ncbi:MAG: Na+/H+ antiporter subunit E [Dethiobacter sp.]|jgi:multicomponent Na+:H+ antiporter subunit E|nr:Na+/H+ antiporter subunit E [Dethiobacter sp.]